jgi:hypothetical protein
MSTVAKELAYNIEAVYKPFDDTNSQALEQLVKARANTKDGMDTSAYDVWRQGVELTDSKYIYGSSQPKIWAGNTLGLTELFVLGQAPSYVDFEGTIAYDDTVYERTSDQVLQNFPVSEKYTQIETGPMYRLEAIMEPLTIRSRISDGTVEPERQFRMGVESGNPSDLYQLGTVTDVVVTTIDYKPAKQTRYFVDGGVRYFGDGSDENKISTPGDRSLVEADVYAFDDYNIKPIVDQINIGTGGDSAAFKQTIALLDINLDEDLRQVYGNRSTVCGGDVYGANQALYGTDSIAYIGTYRG